MLNYDIPVFFVMFCLVFSFLCFYNRFFFFALLLLFGVRVYFVCFVVFYFGLVRLLEGLGWCGARKGPQQPNPSFFILCFIFWVLLFLFYFLFVLGFVATRPTNKQEETIKNKHPYFQVWGILGKEVWQKESQIIQKNLLQKSFSAFIFFFLFLLLLFSSFSFFSPFLFFLGFEMSTGSFQ